MGSATLFLYCVSVVLLIWAALDVNRLLRQNSQIRQTTATIAKIYKPTAAGTQKKKQGYWAAVRYTVNGQIYTAEDRLPVAPTAKIGDEMRISYYTAQPKKLCIKKTKRLVLLLLNAIVCFVIGYLFVIKITKKMKNL